MKDTEYAYAVAYIKTLENKMLTKNDFESLLAAPDFEAALKILIDKGYKDTSEEDITIEDLLKRELSDTWREVINVTPEEAPLEILKYKNDFHNLKTVLKAFITNYDWKELVLEPASVSPEMIFEAIKTNDFSHLPEFLQDTAKGAYEIVTSEHDGQQTEIYIDRKAYENMLSAAGKNEFLRKWVEQNIIFTDMIIALRAFGKSREFIKKAMIPTDALNVENLIDAALEGEESVAEFIIKAGFPEGAEALKVSFGEFEKWCDNKKMAFLREIKNNFFGFEPIMAFLLAKEAEIQAVRIVLSGHKNDIPKEIIRERLRDLYV